MNRRDFISMLASGLLTAPVAAEAQPTGKVHRVGVILTTSPLAEMAGPEPAHPPPERSCRACVPAAT